MGQYCIIVNLTKHEYIAGEAFNSGPKLAEMAEGGGIMRALAILIADGVVSDYSRAQVSGPTGTIAPSRFERLAYSAASLNSNEMVHYFVPACSGTWVGDRIVITGEYAPDGDHMTDGMKEAVGPAVKQGIIAKANLYHFAGFYFDDISEKVAEQIKLFTRGSPDDRFTKTINRFFRDKLSHDYGSLQVKVGKKYKWDLTWMYYELIDSFMLIFNETKADLKAAKAWFRQQQILPWQRELIFHYKDREAQNMGRPTQNLRCTIYDKHNVKVDKSNYEPKSKLLPDRKFIDAALTMEKRLTSTMQVSEVTADAVANIFAAEMGMTGRAERMIDVEPQEEGPDATVSQSSKSTRRANNPRKRRNVGKGNTTT